MSTLAEIETAVGRLTLSEQEELLRRLETNVGRRRTAGASVSRESWMRRLSTMRASIGSSQTTLTGEQILADLRED